MPRAVLLDHDVRRMALCELVHVLEVLVGESYGHRAGTIPRSADHPASRCWPRWR
jgi:hypothetical protein